MSDPNNTVTLYHNPGCSKSRGALELLTEMTTKPGVGLAVCEYLNEPPTASELDKILELLPNSPADLVRNDKNFKALGLSPEDFQTPQQVQALLLQHPELMQRPIAIYQGKAAIGRPPEDLLALFS